MGDLGKVWTDFPEEAASQAVFARSFEKFFHKSWREVMVMGGMPLDHHLNWDAYLAVVKLRRCAGPTLSTLVTEFRTRGLETSNIIFG